MTDLVDVSVPCSTDEHPDGDTVSLRPKLGLAAGVTAQQTIQRIAKDTTSEEVTGLLLESYLRGGVAAWTLHDDTGKPIELTPETLQDQLLDDFIRARPIADKADELYFAAVVAPLVDAVSKSSRATRRKPSTSAPKDSQASPRKPSRRSSTSTTPTAATVATSP